MKRMWGLLIILFLWLFSLFVIFRILRFFPITQKIEAMTIITLVIVTAAYAYQTYLLVKQEEKNLEDERKKRSAEFGKERLESFYYPIIHGLTGLNFALNEDELSYDDIERIRCEIREIFNSHVYMASKNCEDLVNKLLSELREFKKKAIEVELKEEDVKKL